MNEADRLLIFQRQLIITVLILLLFALVFMIGFFFADILRILGIALLLSYMAITTVDWLEKKLKNRAVSVSLVYIIMLAVIGISLLLIVPAVVFQITQLIQTTFNAIPEMLKKLTEMLLPLEQKFHSYQLNVKAQDIMNNIIANLPRPDPTAIVSNLNYIAVGTMTWLLYWISISVVTFYFLLDGYKITDNLIHLFPAKHQPFLQSIATDADKSLQSFFRGQLVLGLAFGLLMMGVYSALGVQYALLLSLFLAVMEILPVIGPPIGFVPAILSVAIHGMTFPGNRLTQVIFLTLIFSVLQQLKDNLVAPKYIGNVIGLHPIMIFIAIMIGARLDGTLGVIFALPVASVLNVLFTHIRRTWSDTPETGTDTQSMVQTDSAQPSTGA
jgi:predicted PurR-regulated permease PerM